MELGDVGDGRGEGLFGRGWVRGVRTAIATTGHEQHQSPLWF